MKTPFVLIIALLLGLGAFLYFEYSLLQGTAVPEETQEVSTPDEEEVFCIQVITPARNIDTGEIYEFPTPCDVPDGWEVIEPEGMEIDLQVI